MKYVITVDSKMTKKELESYLAEKETTMDTIKEIDSSNGKIVDSIIWYEDDIKVALNKNGIEASKENVQIVVRRFNPIHQLMVGNNNETLEDAVSDIKHEGKFN